MIRKMIDEDASYYVEGHVIYITIGGERVAKLIQQVLTRMPDDFEPPTLVIIADGSTAFPLWYPHRYVPTEKSPEMCMGAMGDQAPWIAVLEGELCSEPNNYVTGVIAHEFAHYALRHNAGKIFDSKGKQLLDNEKAANDQARKWGFEKEIAAMHRMEKDKGIREVG